MNSVHLASTGALLALCSGLAAQPQTLQRTRDAARPPAPAAAARAPSLDPGIVTTPPANVDPKAINQPPPRVDRGMIEKPPTVGRSTDRRAWTSEKEPSIAHDCRAQDKHCKQESMR